MSAVLIAGCLALTYIGSRTTYWIIKVFAGFLWWALAFYWVQLPASTNTSLQTILVVVPIGIGLACMFWGFWVTARPLDGSPEKGGFKFPFINNDEEEKTGLVGSSRTRAESYRKRLYNGINGKRTPRA